MQALENICMLHYIWRNTKAQVALEGTVLTPRTLKRAGLLSNPEERSFSCFSPATAHEAEVALAVLPPLRTLNACRLQQALEKNIACSPCRPQPLQHVL